MATKQKILIVDDDNNIAELVALYLTKECFETKIVNDGEEALKQFHIFHPDLILLDLMLPGIDGYQVCREIRHTSDIPIIMLSAKGETFDKVLGLEQGADDYLPKPFHLAELNARIKSVLRRQRSDGSRSLRLGNLRIEPDSFRVFVDDKELELLKKEYDILFYFANRPNHIIDKAVLAEAVWGDHIDQADSFHFVYAQVKNLRQQLKKAGATIEIRSIYGFGYKLVINEEE